MKEVYLKEHLARVVVLAPGVHPKTKVNTGIEAAYTVRPWDSKRFRGHGSLAGGKYETTDFETILTPDEIADPEFAPTLDHLIEAGRVNAHRKLVEDFRLTTLTALTYVDRHSVQDQSDPSITWISYVFALELDEKPELITPKESAGSIWYPQWLIESEILRLLPGHQDVTKIALSRQKDY